MTEADSETVNAGRHVRLHLAIHLEDGTEALSTFAEKPLDLSIGDGTLMPALERLLLGLRSGAEEHFLAHGSDLFGERNPEQIHWLDRGTFHEGIAPAPGQVIAFDTPGGQETAATVLEVEEDRVQVDFNHPLAGRSLRIHVRVLEVSDWGEAPAIP